MLILGFNRLSDETPIEISDLLNAGLSFSESPRYSTFFVFVTESESV